MERAIIKRAWAAANIISQLGSPERYVATRLFADYRYAWEADVLTTHIAATRRVQGGNVLYVRDSSGFGNVFIPGIPSRDYVNAYAVGYAQAITARGYAEAANQYAVQIVIEISALLGQIIRTQPPRQYRLYGHSAGGMIAEIMAKSLAEAGASVCQIMTFGAPKPGLPGCALRGDSPIKVRWVNHRDPVPTLPGGHVGGRYIGMAIAGSTPTFGVVALFTTPGMILQANRALAFDPDRFIHPTPGTLIGLGEPRPIETADNAAGISTLQEWLDGDEAAAQPHLIGSYRAEFSTLLNPPPPEPTVLPRPRLLAAAPEPDVVLPFVPATSPNPMALVGEQRLATVIGRGPGGNTNVPSRGERLIVVSSDPASGRTNGRGFSIAGLIMGNIMANARLTKGYGFTRAKVANEWQVFLAGTYIATAPNASRARTLVKRGNAFLRYMGNLAWSTSGFPTALADQLDLMFAGTGYTPALQLSS